MIEPQLRELQQLLNRKADAVQHQFIQIGERLHALGRQLLEARPGEEEPILAEQAALREKQQALATEVNVWREQARAVLRQPDEASLESYLRGVPPAGDETVQAAIDALLTTISMPMEQRVVRATQPLRVRPRTPAGRLLERARTEYDLRGHASAPRQREAVEFANRAGMALNDDALAELEAAVDDPDPLVAEVAALTVIQLHRFRALRLGDLDGAHASVRQLARLKHPAVIPVLIEILETPRSGYVAGENGMVEGNNRRSRLVALASLVEWRTAAAQAAIRARQRDRDAQMAAAADRALELFPGEWA